MLAIVDRGKVVEGAQVTIDIPQVIFAPGKPIPVTIILKNVRQQSVLRVVGMTVWIVYSFHLSLSNGKQVPRTLYGQKIQDTGVFFARAVHEIRPGAVAITTLPINRLFDMTLPETYELFVSRPVEREYGNGFIDVTSNTIAIEVSEAAGEEVAPEQVI